jgi:hypothetical protein
MTNLDLILLRVFNALGREQNVLPASEAVNLSRSAVSQALAAAPRCADSPYVGRCATCSNLPDQPRIIGRTGTTAIALVN